MLGLGPSKAVAADGLGLEGCLAWVQAKQWLQMVSHGVQSKAYNWVCCRLAWG